VARARAVNGRRALAVVAIVCVAAGRLHGQQQRLRVPTYAELRGDAILGDGAALQAGGGIVFPGGIYVRINVDGAAGTRFRDGQSRTSGRADLIARFLLDPFREMPVGLSLGGGVTVPYTDGDTGVQPYLTAVIDIEGRRRGRFTPALQIGLGGGTRLGVVLRTSTRAWR